jgi:hypothetical protein
LLLFKQSESVVVKPEKEITMNFLRNRQFVFMVMLSVCFAFKGQSQSFIQNGDFEVTTFAPGPEPGFLVQAVGPGDTRITGWTTTGSYNGSTFPPATITYVKGALQDPVHGVGGQVELGTYYTLAGIQQTFATTPHESYTVSFYVASNPLNFLAGPAVLRVGADGSYADFTATPGTGDAQNMGWRLNEFSFIAGAAGTTTLQFWNLQGLAVIDGVSVVPEPRIWIIASVAVGFLFGRAWMCRPAGSEHGRISSECFQPLKCE